MTAWQRLIAGSALPSGTAWEHLNAQGGTGSGTGDIFIYGELEVELMADSYDVETEGDFDVESDDEITVELDDETV
jgi:hypothetical protein